MTEDRSVPQTVIEKDIDFDSVLRLIRIATKREAADLLHSAFRVAFNNGEHFGMEGMAKLTDDVFEQFAGRQS